MERPRFNLPKFNLPHKDIRTPDLKKVGQVVWKSRQHWAAVGVLVVANAIGGGVALNALRRLANTENNLAQSQAQLKADETLIQKLINANVIATGNTCITIAHVQRLEELPNGLTNADCDSITQQEVNYWEKAIEDAKKAATDPQPNP